VLMVFKRALASGRNDQQAANREGAAPVLAQPFISA
jgi:hypothetical protein